MMGAGDNPDGAAEEGQDKPENSECDGHAERGGCPDAGPSQKVDHADLAHAPATDRDGYHSDEEGNRDERVEWPKADPRMKGPGECGECRKSQHVRRCCEEQTCGGVTLAGHSPPQILRNVGQLFCDCDAS